MSETTPDLRERLDQLVEKWRHKSQAALLASHTLGSVGAFFDSSYERGKADARRFSADELDTLLREAAAALAVPRQPAEGWQPIATAPQDEQRVVLFNPDESMGSWAVQTGAHYEQLGGWQYDGQNPAYSNAHPPTHWMPLPPLPHGQDASPQRTEGTNE